MWQGEPAFFLSWIIVPVLSERKITSSELPSCCAIFSPAVLSRTSVPASAEKTLVLPVMTSITFTGGSATYDDRHTVVPSTPADFRQEWQTI